MKKNLSHLQKHKIHGSNLLLRYKSKIPTVGEWTHVYSHIKRD